MIDYITIYVAVGIAVVWWSLRAETVDSLLNDAMQETEERALLIQLEHATGRRADWLVVVCAVIGVLIWPWVLYDDFKQSKVQEGK